MHINARTLWLRGGEKTLVWIIRELNLLSFSLKLFSDYFLGLFYIKTVRVPLKLS